jgi:uncharacterized protein YbjT (DUF2867 family)
VIILSRRGEVARGPLPDSVEVRHADVTRSDGLMAALVGADALVVALAFDNSPMEAPRRHQTFMEVDAAGTEHLVAAAREAGVHRLVYLSGAGAAPNAKRHWFRAKWRAEEAVRASGLTWTILRPTWIYGPRDGSLNRFLGFARQYQVVPMTNFGRQLLAPVFIDDIRRLAADSLIDPAAANQVFEVGGPQAFRMRDVIGHALRIADLSRAGLARAAGRRAVDIAVHTAADPGRSGLHQPARHRRRGTSAQAHAPATDPAGRRFGELPGTRLNCRHPRV